MPTFDPSNTKRWFLDYSDGLHDHTLMVRSANSVDATGLSSFLDDWFTAWSSVLYSIDIVGLRVAAQNSHISLPATWGGAASYGSGTMPANRAPLQLCIVGRDDDGVRFRAFLFAFSTAVPDNFRYPRGEATVIDDVLTLMEGSSTIFQTVNGKPPIYNPYADVNYNSYWERAVRAT